MKLCIVTLSLLLALPFAAQAQTKETRTFINGRSVVVRTETTTQAPAAVQTAVAQNLDQQGWHDEIYRTLGDKRAVMIFTQRDANACTLKEVKITLWRASEEKGKTVTEAWVYNLKPSEVNRFLDDELPHIASKFATESTQKS